MCPVCSKAFTPNLLRDTILPCCGELLCGDCRFDAVNKPCPLECEASAGAVVPSLAGECIAMIQKKMNAGEAWAQWLLGTYLQIGKFVVKDAQGGFKLLQLAANQVSFGGVGVEVQG